MSRNRRVARGPARTVVNARGPADLVAAVPYLMGFVPSASIVVVSLRGPRLRLGVVARLDLPPAGREHDTAAAIAAFVRRDGPREAVVLVYDDRPWTRWWPRPHQLLVDAVGDDLGRHGVPVREAVYVGGQRFWSYSCTMPGCCPADGWPMRDAKASEVAATYVLQGRSPLADRQGLVDRVAPGDPATLAAVENAIDTCVAAVGPQGQDTRAAGRRAWQRARASDLDTLARRYAAGERGLSADEAGRALAGLLDHEVRDVVAVRWTRWMLSLAAPGTADEVTRPVAELADDSTPPDLDDLELAEAVEQLLVDLAVRADGPAAVAPLTLLAMQCWACGNGAAAGVAVDRALAIDPAYRMATLVDQLLRAGLAPRWAADVRADDEAPGRRRLVSVDEMSSRPLEPPDGSC